MNEVAEAFEAAVQSGHCGTRIAFRVVMVGAVVLAILVLR